MMRPSPKSIQHKFIFLFLLLLLPAILIIAGISFSVTEKAVIESVLVSMENDLGERVHRTRMFHDKAKSDLLMAVEYPAFQDYFNLPETKAGNRYDDKGVIQFSPDQRALKDRLDLWSLALQKRFPIVETCLIDQTGQEHTRITFGEIAPDDDFSSEEHQAPFFAPTMALPKGEVHVNSPYMSPDAGAWVFSYTTPLLLEDGSKPAFFHFEIPVARFQDFLTGNKHAVQGHKNEAGHSSDNHGAATSHSTGNHGAMADHQANASGAEKKHATASAPAMANHQASGKVGQAADKSGRTIILTEEGLVVADSLRSFDMSLKTEHAEVEEPPLEDYLPRLDAEGQGYDILRQRMAERKPGRFQFTDQHGTAYYAVYAPLPTFGWTIAHLKTYDTLLSGKSSLAGIKAAIAGTALVMILIAVFTIWLATGRITGPLKRLTVTAQRIAEGQLNVAFDGDAREDEAGRLQVAMGKMAERLGNTVRSIVMQSDAVTACTSELVDLRQKLYGDAGETYEVIREIAADNDGLSRDLSDIDKAVREASSHIEAVFQAVQNLNQQVENIGSGAGLASDNAIAIAAASEEMSANISSVNQSLERVNMSVTTVAAAIEEMSLTLEGVQKRCEAAAEQTREAAGHAHGTRDSMRKLSSSASEINRMVQMISQIADQTNMLALNAAIEAAGAGEAGKGFAVVAVEVKDLARQTGEATRMITQKVSEIRSQTEEAVASATRIADLVQDVSETNQEILFSVDEQGSAVREISTSVNAVAREANEVTRHSQEMLIAAQESARSAAESAARAQSIAREARQVSSFANNVTESSAHAQKFVLSILNSTRADERADSSAKVQRAKSLANFVAGSANYLNHLSDVYEETSANLREAQAGLETGGAPFDAQSIKKAHLRWLGRLEEVIHGRLNMSLEEVGNHHQCDLGKWYDAEVSRFGHLPVYQEMGRVHERIHILAKETVAAAHGGHLDQARANVRQFAQLRANLFKLLDQFYLEVRE